jgi:hypothetical protein
MVSRISRLMARRQMLRLSARVDLDQRTVIWLFRRLARAAWRSSQSWRGCSQWLGRPVVGAFQPPHLWKLMVVIEADRAIPSKYAVSGSLT